MSEESIYHEIKPIKEGETWIAECAVCGKRYENHCGSTECCGSIAYIVDEDGSTDSKRVPMLIGKIK